MINNSDFRGCVNECNKNLNALNFYRVEESIVAEIRNYCCKVITEKKSHKDK